MSARVTSIARCRSALWLALGAEPTLAPGAATLVASMVPGFVRVPMPSTFWRLVLAQAGQ